MQKDIILSNERILLRPYCTDDARHVFEAARESIGDMVRWMPWCHPGYSIEESQNWIKSCAETWDKGTAYEFAILDSRGGGYLGGCGLNHIDPIYKIANLGYWVRSSRTGAGVAPAAALLLARFGFSELHLNRIEIVAAVGNMKSQRAAEKAGAKREGVLRNRIAVKDRIHDAVMFSFIPQDLGPGNER